MTHFQEKELEQFAPQVFESGVSTSEACHEIVSQTIEPELGLPKNFVLYSRGRAFF